MGFPLFKVTLSNDIEGSLVISEPGGWDEAVLLLERNEDFHSLVEFYDQPLTFYGEDIAEDGGINFIRNIEQTQGPDAQIVINIEVSHDEGQTYEELVENTLSVETIKEMDFYKLESGVIRNGFWQYFMNRRDTPIDLSSVNDLDGNARTVINPVTIQLPSQKIRQNYYAQVEEFETASYQTVPNNQYGQIDFPRENIAEIKEKFNYPLVENSQRPFELFSMEFAGDYAFEIRLYTATSVIFGTGTGTDLDAIIQKNDEAPIILNKTGGSSGLESWTVHSYDDTLTLAKGDFVRLYFQNVSGGLYSWVLFAGLFHDSYLRIVADTIFPDTTCEGFLLHDAGNSITDRIIGRDGTLYSEYLGNSQTQIQTYAEDGCGSKYALARGLNIRGYSLADKPFFMSFNTWWNGVNPLLNLGLGYERIGSPELEVLRIEPKEYFYNPTPSVYFDFVNNIERSYDLDYIWKVIEIGFEKWSVESDSGLDDPQSKRIYNTRFKTIGKEIRILSKFIGASLVWEQTRRNRVEQGKDFNTDDNVFIVAVNLDGSPEFQPELDENFTSVTNLLNSDTRYNIRLSVARNFERWKVYFNGCLQWYVAGGETFKFASGEGNFAMTSQLDSGDCEATGSSPEVTVVENGNIEATNDHLCMPVMYSFEHPMTWDEYQTIRDNRNNAIGVSRTAADHKICFIKKLSYEITKGNASFVVNVKGSESGYDPEDVYFT